MRTDGDPSRFPCELTALPRGSTQEICGLLQECELHVHIDSAVIAGLGVPAPVPLPVPVPVPPAFHLFNHLHVSWDGRKSGPKSKSRTVATPLPRVARPQRDGGRYRPAFIFSNVIRSQNNGKGAETTPIIGAYSKHKVGLVYRETPWEDLDHTLEIQSLGLRSRQRIHSTAPL